MDKIISVDLIKNADVNEFICLNALESALGDAYKITKTKDPNCNVDFVVRRNNKVIGYAELKCRAQLYKYPDFYIGVVKLRACQRIYRKTIFMWYDVDAEIMWYCKFSDDLLDSEREGNKFKIPVEKCKHGFENLLDLFRASKW